MIDARRKVGAIDVPADSWGLVDLKANSGEVVEITSYVAMMDAGAAGSVVLLKLRGSDLWLERATDSSPELRSTTIKMYVSDTIGIVFAGKNAATGTKKLYYALWGVKL